MFINVQWGSFGTNEVDWKAGWLIGGGEVGFKGHLTCIPLPSPWQNLYEWSTFWSTGTQIRTLDAWTGQAKTQIPDCWISLIYILLKVKKKKQQYIHIFISNCVFHIISLFSFISKLFCTFVIMVNWYRILE